MRMASGSSTRACASAVLDTRRMLTILSVLHARQTRTKVVPETSNVANVRQMLFHTQLLAVTDAPV
jgi:hypothetical protein